MNHFSSVFEDAVLEIVIQRYKESGVTNMTDMIIEQFFSASASMSFILRKGSGVDNWIVQQEFTYVYLMEAKTCVKNADLRMNCVCCGKNTGTGV